MAAAAHVVNEMPEEMHMRRMQYVDKRPHGDAAPLMIRKHISGRLFLKS